MVFADVLVVEGARVLYLRYGSQGQGTLGLLALCVNSGAENTCGFTSRPKSA